MKRFSPKEKMKRFSSLRAHSLSENSPTSPILTYAANLRDFFKKFEIRNVHQPSPRNRGLVSVFWGEEEGVKTKALRDTNRITYRPTIDVVTQYKGPDGNFQH